ncbi:MAG: pyrroline-5-carboxylate reductase [Deltaproteobacteria bacterium]|nr:pyrroline-5-carboxylate reductase [Deltaproteobacteria bacterium]MBW1848573.1 pyrroline-5-carboxylate reductase [Deltaproteobacteria bacterium]MBW2366132.1 pyrroline-5-carboxylate reductase [Deltaproteobacteria bacterium]
MKKITSKIGFIGAGNMGEALVGALIKSNITEPKYIYASDASEKKLKNMSKEYGIHIRNDNFKLFLECDIIILAVKPQQMSQVLSEISGNVDDKLPRKKLIISIAAGVSIRRLENLLYKRLNEKNQKKLPIVRVMPNTPALVLAGVSGMSANKFTSRNDINVSKTILESAGEVIEFDEKDLDAVTAVSGSGPAYVFYFIESMITGGTKAGLSLKNSEKLTLETVKGAVKLLEESNDSAETLRKKVASPGGTTEAALRVLEKTSVKASIVKAIAAAKKRSKELRKLY